jgi:hypothetical protein
MAPGGYSEKILPLQWSRIKPHCDFLVPQLFADIGLSAFYFRVSAQLQANLTHERAELSKSPNFRSGTRIAALGSSQRSPTRTRLDFLRYTVGPVVHARNLRPKICPRCGGRIIRRSHRKNFAEKARSFLFIRPYRCVDCHYRFWGFWLPWKLSFLKMLIRQHSANNPNKITSARDH